MATEEYGRKRDFARTPEPAPEQNSGHLRTFVVHRHEARSLHYDFRVEIGGALACWAVPKGFSYEPSDKRLAVKTEDHPLEYESFEGVIPKGQYGAGNMTIWDSGEYELRKSPTIQEALEKGELKLVLRGRRLRGEWHLVRTAGEGGREWLLFKAKDRYAGSGSDLFGSADLSNALLKPIPKRLSPMEPRPDVALFSDPDWLFEAAFPGIRVQIVLRGEEKSLRSQNRDLAPQLPAVCAALARVRAQNAIMDGVLVAMGKDGIPSKVAVEEELARGGDGALLYVFDLLYAEEWDLRRLPLKERKAVLRNLVVESAHLLVMNPVAERGEALAQVAAESGLPALMAKRADSQYTGGLSDDWRRIALQPGGQEAGVTSPVRRRQPTSSLQTIGHPRKVYWPDQGYTKEDLVRYYDRVAAVLIPYLKDRPVHLYRWPDGIRGKSFYQKQFGEGLPEWIQTVNIAGPEEEPRYYIACGDRRSLLALINFGTIDLHPWLSRMGSLDSPDWAVLDLDPKGAAFSDVVKIARATGKLLRGLGLEPYLKTSGSTGLHICIPLKPGYTYDQSRMFCEAIARIIVREHGQIATIERVIGRRAGRVYIDFMQNRREQTIVPPYVARPVEAATVSMPLSWDELEDDVRISDFTIMTAPARIEKTGDLFRTAFKRPQDLAKAIKTLGDLVGS